MSWELVKPKTYARDLIESLVSNIQIEWEKYTGFIIEWLQLSDNAVEKEALLYTFGFMQPSFKELKESYGEIENILMKHCF